MQNEQIKIDSFKKQKALIIAPGRGSYNKTELNYLKKFHSDKKELIAEFDDYRKANNQQTISELDNSSKYELDKFSRGDNASSLIYACAYADFLAINRDKFDVVAVTGNSMGWYIALACAQALSEMHAFKLINNMGNLMHNSLIGGQLIHPLYDKSWQEIAGRKELFSYLMDEINAKDDCIIDISIDLVGLIVFAGNDKGLKALKEALPKDDPNFPIILPNHSAFHTNLQEPISVKAKEMMRSNIFTKPKLPLIDGNGRIWYPHSTDLEKLWDYTLGEQITETYDYNLTVKNALKEIAPDKIIILGPGKSLSISTAQCLLDLKWKGITSREVYKKHHIQEPIIISMGVEEERNLVL